MCSPRILRIAARAEMAELADALRSGRSGGSLVWVQIPLSAPLFLIAFFSWALINSWGRRANHLLIKLIFEVFWPRN
jgi:hypothetical protein